MSCAFCKVSSVSNIGGFPVYIYIYWPESASTSERHPVCRCSRFKEPTMYIRCAGLPMLHYVQIRCAGTFNLQNNNIKTIQEKYKQLKELFANFEYKAPYFLNYFETELFFKDRPFIKNVSFIETRKI